MYSCGKKLKSTMGRSIKLSPSSILLEIDNSIASGNEQKIINHAILIGEMCISKFKYGKPTHLISLFQTECETRQLKISLHNKAVSQLLPLMLLLLLLLLLYNLSKNKSMQIDRTKDLLYFDQEKTPLSIE